MGSTTALAVAVAATVALLLLGVMLPSVADRLDAGISRLAQMLAGGVAIVLSVLAWAFVLLPVWALSRLVGYSPIDAGWSSPRSAWNAADLGGRRDPQRRPDQPGRSGSPDPWTGPQQRRRRAWRAAVVVAVVAALLGVAVVVVVVAPRSEAPAPVATIDLRGTVDDGAPTTFADLPVDEYAHEDEPFAPDLFREIIAAGAALRPDSVLGVRNVDIRGEHVNVVDGRRVTYSPDDPTLEVWFFGGSTTFGVGQRDEHTIPSVVARLAEADGVRIRATNFGVNGDVNWQETLRFAEALGGDLPSPDLVVFYDGWNDESLGMYRAEIGSVDAATSERLPFSDLDRDRESVILGGRDRLGPGSEQVALGIPLAAAQYGRGVRTARSLAAAEGAEVLHFWQPIAAVKQYFPSDDELLRRTGLQPRWRDQRVAEYGAIREHSGVDPIDLSTALDQVDRPVYFDHGHTNEMGARVVAEAMYAHLRPVLMQRDRTG
jgi:lysophospholipase L1-like esterase